MYEGSEPFGPEPLYDPVVRVSLCVAIRAAGERRVVVLVGRNLEVHRRSVLPALVVLADREHGRRRSVVLPNEPAQVAETLAAEAGVDTAVLSPLEGLTDEQEAVGDDYLSVMRRNLETLRDGLDCT